MELFSEQYCYFHVMFNWEPTFGRNLFKGASQFLDKSDINYKQQLFQHFIENYNDYTEERAHVKKIFCGLVGSFFAVVILFIINELF